MKGKLPVGTHILFRIEDEETSYFGKIIEYIDCLSDFPYRVSSNRASGLQTILGEDLVAHSEIISAFYPMREEEE